MALSVAAKRDLAQFIAANGENYSMYQAFAKQRGWVPFTPGYLHTWVNRHRDDIRACRVVHQEYMRKVTVLTREARLRRIERAVERVQDRIDALPEDDESDEKLIKLTDQLRKLLQHIAQERGEWNKPDDAAGDNPYQLVLERMKELMPPREPTITVEPIIEGEIVELPAEASQ